MIKVHKVNCSDARFQESFININAITAFQETAKGTELLLMDGTVLVITEKPETLINMIEDEVILNQKRLGRNLSGR